MHTSSKKIVLVGFGTVGQGFYHYFSENKPHNKLTSVVIKDKFKERKPSNLPFSTNSKGSISNKNVATVIELITDPKEAYNIVKQALIDGKQVVSANKKMIAYHIEELLELEQKNGGKLLYEAAVAGSIPILKVINEHYTYDEITQIRGVINGTSNYILTQIFEHGFSYQQALTQAQKSGFAEEDPTDDVGGFDALYKLVLLSAHAFGKFIHPEKVLNIGIENISVKDIEFAKNNKLKIKLVAQAIKQNNKLTLSVLPTFVDVNDDLFHINNEYNAIEIISNNIGTQFYKGKGAGKLPTGHVVYTDYQSIDNTSYSYKHTLSGKRIKYETKESIWIFSNKITSLEKYLEEIFLVEEPQGYGKIKISDLIKAKAFIQQYKLSVIKINSTLQKKLTESSHLKYNFVLN